MILSFFIDAFDALKHFCFSFFSLPCLSLCVYLYPFLFFFFTDEHREVLLQHLQPLPRERTRKNRGDLKNLKLGSLFYVFYMVYD